MTTKQHFAIISSAFMSVPLIMASASINASESESDYLVRMQRHWQQVTVEKDLVKRQALVGEHRDLLAQGRKILAQSEGKSSAKDHMQGAAMHDAHHTNLMNTIELHSSMLDLIE